jgi:hypothetical protein
MGQDTFIGTSGDSLVGNPGLDGESGVFTGKVGPIMPLDAFVEVEGDAASIGFLSPALGQVRDNLGIVVGVYRHDIVHGS